MSQLEPDNTIQDQLKGLFDEKDTSGAVEAMKQLFNRKDIKMKSEVDKKFGEAEYFSGLSVLGSLLKAEPLKTYVDETLQLRVSNGRMGRREAVEMNRQTPDVPKDRGLFSWFR